MEAHEEVCEHQKSICNNCHEVVSRGDKQHDCLNGITNRISRMEKLIYEIGTKLEKPAEDSDHEDDKKGHMCFRHEFIQDYSLEFSIYHQNTNHYQITLPAANLPMSENARCLILRVLVHDSAVARLFSRCSIRQTGEKQGVNLSNHIMPVAGAPLIFETFLPWNKEGPAQIAIEWDKSHHAHCLLHPPSFSHTYSYGGGHSHSLSKTHGLGLTNGGGMNTAIPASKSPDHLSSPHSSANLHHGELTHGIIYVGVAGFLE